MDSPQYSLAFSVGLKAVASFKPYYKWIVLNTLNLKRDIDFMVL